jgi:DNA-binding Lrp family transcriptional regulator
MDMMKFSDETLQEAVKTYNSVKSCNKTAELLGISRSSAQRRVKAAAERGLFGYTPVMPAFRVSQVTTNKDGDPVSIQQKPAHGEPFQIPEGHSVKGVSALIDESGREIVKWVKTKQEYPTEELIRTVVDELKKDIKPVKPEHTPKNCENQLLNQYVVTDHHFGQLSWGLETGGKDYDLRIAEEIILNWFKSAIALAPAAHTGVFAQLGDFMHYDSMEAVTPSHRNILDTDSRIQKIIRVVIRVTRQIISMLLQKHKHVHLIWASANHDPTSSAWMRELLQALYDNEPRITIDSSPDLYYSYEWGRTALFYHHGHRRKVSNVDSVFAGKFKELYGHSDHAYAHIGHLHTDAVLDSNLMRVERHRTLAPPDAYSSGLGWISKQDAKIITYHRQYGEVSRLTISPAMIGEAKIKELVINDK